MKNIKYMLFIFIMCFAAINVVNAEEFSAETFCTGPVQGVFTTLGWVFLIVKILVPIILIVMGTIDVAKAVVASKDDELKKSIQTLAKRAIAGVIIFFIPNILSFIVKLVDNDNIYKGTFNNCTQCMLNPNYKFVDGTTCKGLEQ